MKRVLLAALSIIVFASYSHSQFTVAVIGGAQQSQIREDNNLPGWDTLKKKYSARTGVHFGFTGNLRLGAGSRFYLQPSVIFYNKGRNYKSSPVDTTIIVSSPQQPDSIVNTFYYRKINNYINYVDIPINLVYKLPLGNNLSVVLGGGPYFSLFYNGFEKRTFVINGVSSAINENDDLPIGNGSNKYATLDYGINGLAGIEYGRLILTANYSRGLKNFYQPGDYTATNYKHEVMGATLGVYFGKAIPPAPKDTDGDGTPDQADKCPTVAGPLKFLGCPDTDNDGIPDAEDQCPGEAGPAENKGCPDTDKDGDKVPDRLDKCPDKAGPVENGGCPYPDRDGDGINDNDDKCPDVAGSVRYGGCPIPDSDGDGINDEEDKCPQEKGTKENNGCPVEIRKDITEKVEYSAKRIRFQASSAELTKESFAVLDSIAGILKNNPEIKVSIDGHTSSEGNYNANMKLSQTRADKVKAYLLSKGINAARLTAAGFGSSRPLNADKTAADKAKNRRVELKLSK